MTFLELLIETRWYNILTYYWLVLKEKKKNTVSSNISLILVPSQ